MERGRVLPSSRYRRARALLYVIGLFWLWLWLGSTALLHSLHHAPLYAILAVYAIAVAVIVSLAAALLAAARMILERPVRGGVVVPLPVAQAPAETHWWHDQKIS